jgi:uncharacterized protein YdaU (DUF1376 family)
MNSLPYMQFYVNDYLADTAHLNATQHGAYILLLMNYWQRGKPLDNTNERLASVARMTIDEWQDNKEIIAEFFWIDGDIWTHARIENDLIKVKEKSKYSSIAGQKSAAQRSFNSRSTDVQQPFNHTDTDTDTKKDIYTNDFETFWDTYPIKIGKGTAFKAWIKALKKASMETIIEGAERYAKDPNRENEFTAHPATWLNGERWLDSPLPQKQARFGSKPLSEPTRVPPPFSANEVVRGVPVPENIRDLIRGMSDKA